MANIKLSFLGTENSGTENTELQCFCNNEDEIFISINDNYPQHICLDRETAIKLVRTLKREISYIND